MKQQIELPIGLTPKDWRFIDEISAEVFGKGERSQLDDVYRTKSGRTFRTSILDKIREYSQIVQDKNLADNTPLDTEHRQYLSQRDWDTIRALLGEERILSKQPDKLGDQVLLQPRRIFCYAYNEEGVSYTLDDFFHWLNSGWVSGGDNRRFAVDHQSDDDMEGGNDYVEWDSKDNCWHYYENDGWSRKWYDNGSASSRYASMILENWLLITGDVNDVMRTSPSHLDEILRSKAEQKPGEVQKALDSKRIHNWEILESCYAEVSVRLFKQLGLTAEEDIARALQEEHFFHSGKRPVVYAYNWVIGDKSERQFRRFQSEEDAKAFLEDYKDAKLILPAEK